MTSALDAVDDLSLVADQLESVTLRRRGGGPAANIAHALRRAVTARELDASGSKLAAQDVVWHLPANELADAPQIGDVIVPADGQRWTILELTRSTATGRWRALCRDLALAHRLNDVVCLQKAAWHKGTAGALSIEWKDQQFGIAARIEPGPTVAVIEQDRVASHTSCRVMLVDEVPIGGRQRLVDSANRVYAIERHEPADRVELPHVLHVVRQSE